MLKHYEQDSSTCIVDSINDPFLLLLDCGPDVLINGEGFETYFPRPIKNGFPSGKYHAEHYAGAASNEPCGADGFGHLQS